MITPISVGLGVLGVFLLLANSPALGCLTMIIGALIFIAGNRAKREREEKRRHEELLEAARQGKNK